MLRFFRWHLLMGLVVLIFVGSGGSLALSYFFPSPPTKLTIGTGFKGGSYEFYGKQYQQILARSHIQLEVRLTAATGQNLKLLMDATSGVQVAFVQGGVANSKLAPGLISLGRIGHQIFCIFYRATETLDDVTQLKGKRIAVGPEGSGTQVVAAKILGIAGVTSNNATMLPFAGQSAVDALKDGRADVAFIASVPEAPIVQSLIRDPNIRLMSFSRSKAITRILPFLVPLELAQGMIDFANNIPFADATLVATGNSVLVRSDLHPEIIRLLTQTLLEVHRDAGLFQHYGDFPTTTDPEYPMSAIAVEYYKNGPSLLQSYLPPWLTIHAQRAIAALLTAIAIGLPLFAYGPRVVRWFVRERTLKLYRRLRVVEARLAKTLTADDIAPIRDELERIEEAAIATGFPNRYSDILFGLKVHINLMRTRLAARLAEAPKQIAKAT